MGRIWLYYLFSWQVNPFSLKEYIRIPVKVIRIGAGTITISMRSIWWRLIIRRRWSAAVTSWSTVIRDYDAAGLRQWAATFRLIIHMRWCISLTLVINPTVRINTWIAISLGNYPFLDALIASQVLLAQGAIAITITYCHFHALYAALAVMSVITLFLIYLTNSFIIFGKFRGDFGHFDIDCVEWSRWALLRTVHRCHIFIYSYWILEYGNTSLIANEVWTFLSFWGLII